MYLGQLLDDGVAAATCTRQGLAINEFQAAHGDAGAEGSHVRRVLRARRTAPRDRG